MVVKAGLFMASVEASLGWTVSVEIMAGKSGLSTEVLWSLCPPNPVTELSSIPAPVGFETGGGVTLGTSLRLDLEESILNFVGVGR